MNKEELEYNQELFLEDYDKELKKEKLKLREDFLRTWGVEEIKNLTLKNYCLGD